jgi:hypothetical protein
MCASIEPPDRLIRCSALAAENNRFDPDQA